MKIITNRQEIAQAMNFGRYPVLHLDIAKDAIKGFSGCYTCQAVKIKTLYQGKDLNYYGKLCYWGDNNTMTVQSKGVMLTSSFGYSDIVEDIENANSIEIKGEQEVIVVIMNSAKHLTSYPILTKTTKFTKGYSTLTTIEGDFKDIFLALQ